MIGHFFIFGIDRAYLTFEPPSDIEGYEFELIMPPLEEILQKLDSFTLLLTEKSIYIIENTQIGGIMSKYCIALSQTSGYTAFLASIDPITWEYASDRCWFDTQEEAEKVLASIPTDPVLGRPYIHYPLDESLRTLNLSDINICQTNQQYDQNRREDVR